SWMIRSVGGFPIQRDGKGAEGVKETLRRLKHGGLVTFFPEGTRSDDGNLGELKPGLVALIARAKVPVVPIGLAGTFDAWPKHRLLPKMHPIRIHYGPPIMPEQFEGLDPQASLELLKGHMIKSLEVASEGLAIDCGRSCHA